MIYPTPPKNMMEFSRTFATNEACAAYLFNLRWLDGYACPKCGATKAYRVRGTPSMVQCPNHHKISVTAGTALHRTKQPLTLWFHAAWLVATLKPGISALQFQRQMGFSRLETAWTMLHKLRAGLVAPEREQLSTDCDDPTHTDHWVEIDEVYVGGEEHGTEHRGRGAETKSLVAIAVEVHEWTGDTDERDLPAKRRGGKEGKGALKGQHTRAGRCRMRVIPDAKGVTLAQFITDNVKPGSRIWTDAHLGYRNAETLYPRSITVANASDDPLPTLGRVTTNLKRWLIGTHKGAVRAQHLQAYLNEYVFRFNRRDIPWIAFNRALGLAAHAPKAAEYAGLYRGAWVHPNPNPTLCQGGRE
jgi:transposase-like protein